MYNNFVDRGILEEEFRKSRARVVADHYYYGRGSYSAYFSNNSHNSNYTEVVSKFIHHTGKVNDLIKYVSDQLKTGSEDHIYKPDGSILSLDDLKDLKNDWHERNSKDTRQNARHSTHIILSTKEAVNKKNIAMLRDVVSSIAMRKFFLNGYDCFFVIHTDKPHLHAHLIVHNRNLLTNKKIRFTKYTDMFDIRKKFADLLCAKGLQYSASLKKDSMKVLDGLSEQKKNQNWVLNKVDDDLGPTARSWAKKQFILKYSDNPEKAKKAKQNLVFIRHLEDPKARGYIQEQVDEYQQQREKWDMKKTAIENHRSLDPKHVSAFIDSLYASHRILERRYNSKNKKTVEDYQSVSKLIDKLPELDLTDQIVTFTKKQQLKQQRNEEVKNFEIFGDIGKQYLRQLHRNLDFAKTDKQRGIINQKISDLKEGRVDESEFDYFRNTLVKENVKPFKNNLNQRLLAIKKRVAQSSGVSLEKVTEVDKIFSLYIARRSSDSIYAYRKFESAVDQYAEVLKTGDNQKLYMFTKILDQRLSIDPEQKYNIKRNAIIPEIKL